MSFVHHKITTASPVEISAIDAEFGDAYGSPKSMTICNLDASGDDCVIDLYLDDEGGADTINPLYILHSVTIPSGATLLLEQTELTYDSTIYGLWFLLNSVSGTQLIDIKLTYQ